MAELKKALHHQRKVTLFHKSGSKHEFEPIDAKDILRQPDTEYARELSFWDKLKETVANVAEVAADVAEQVVEVVDAAAEVQAQVEDTVNEVTDVVKPKKKG